MLDNFFRDDEGTEDVFFSDECWTEHVIHEEVLTKTETEKILITKIKKEGWNHEERGFGGFNNIHKIY